MVDVMQAPVPPSVPGMRANTKMKTQACGGACGDECGVDEYALSYVGAGKGNYAEHRTYKFVGEGVGEYDMMPVPKGRVNILACIGIPFCICLLCPVLWFCWLLLPGSETTTTSVGYTSRAPSLSGSSEPYDCIAGYSNWHRGWSIGKRVWCCKTYGRGCASTSSRPADPFDCEEGEVPSWSIPQKIFCCHNFGKACPTTTTSAPFDCDEGFDTWQTGWIMHKKVYCCLKAHRGCPETTPSPEVSVTTPSATTPPTTTPPGTGSTPFDCNAGYVNWEAAWSVPKKEWCCQHGGRGCATTFLPYDCSAGFSDWQAGWSVGKKAWCCQHGGRSCPAMALTMS